MSASGGGWCAVMVDDDLEFADNTTWDDQSVGSESIAVQTWYRTSSTSTLIVAVPVESRGSEAQDAEVQEGMESGAK
jgi:hypothetical protein